MLTNSKEEALNMAFRGEQSAGAEEDGVQDLTKAIIEDVLRMPGNELCCDCGAQGTQVCVCVCQGNREMVSVCVSVKLETERYGVNACVCVSLICSYNIGIGEQ